MKKIYIVLLMTVCIVFVPISVHAVPEVNTDALDSAIESTEHISFFGSCKEIFEAINNNTFSLDGKSVTENILLLFFGGIKKTIPSISVLLSLCIILSVAEKLKLLSPKTESIALLGGKIIFACALTSSMLEYAQGAKSALEGISDFTQVLSPILLTLLAFCGARGSLGALTPSAGILSSVPVFVSVNIVMPLIISGCVISFVDSLLGNSKLSGIAGLIKTCATFVLGGTFTVFSALILIQGATGGAADGVALRGLKYALSSSVPIIGGTVSESITAVLAGGMLIKSAAGITGIIAIIGIIAVPTINIGAYIIALKLLSACAGTFTSKYIMRQISSACEFLKLMLILLFGVGVLWIIYLGIIIGAGKGIL